MSATMSQARARVARSVPAAVERARLTVVPSRRFRAPRAPFAVLVLAILAAGVFGLLMFNTHMQQASFHANALQRQADALSAERQALEMELERLRDPQAVAAAGRKLGMVPPVSPAFIRLGDGTVAGKPTPATPDGAIRINPLPPAKPGVLAPPPVVVRVPAVTTAGTGAGVGTTAGTATDTGADATVPPTGAEGAR